MCIEDIRLGRKARSILRIVAVSPNGDVLVQRNKHRIALVIGVSIAANFYIQEGETPVDLVGFLMVSGGTPLYLNVKEHGDIVTKKLTAISHAGTLSIGIIETILEDE